MSRPSAIELFELGTEINSTGWFNREESEQLRLFMATLAWNAPMAVLRKPQAQEALENIARHIIGVVGPVVPVVADEQEDPLDVARRAEQSEHDRALTIGFTKRLLSYYGIFEKLKEGLPKLQADESIRIFNEPLFEDEKEWQSWWDWAAESFFNSPS